MPVAEFGSIVVLSMFFSPSGSADPLTTILKLGVLALIVTAIGSGVVARSMA